MKDEREGGAGVENISLSHSATDGHMVGSSHETASRELPTPAVLRVSSSAVRSGDDEALLERSSIIHLLRVYVGAVRPEPEPEPEPCAPSTVGGTDLQQEGGDGDEACSPHKCLRHSPPLSPARSDDAAVGATAPADASSVSARIEAGCTLWDISVTEEHASAMCSAGLVPVACTVLRHCTEAEELLTGAGVTDSSYRLAERGKGGLGEGGGGRREGGTGVSGGVVDACNGMSLQEATRLREITCGLLANAFSHRTLRREVIGDASLGGELLLVFHSSDDPACLTEVLRLFSAAAMTATAATPEGYGETRPPAAVLASGLVERDTLERLAFFLENSLEEKLLAWACSLAYSVMYRHGDDVIRPLVEEFRLEESLASLLNTRSTDLSYEQQLGGAETGLDILLRCLEVLSTSEVSSIGPSIPPQHPSCSSAEVPAPADIDQALPVGSVATLSAVIEAGNSDIGGAAIAAAAADGSEDACLPEAQTNATSAPEEAADLSVEAAIAVTRGNIFNAAVAPAEPRESMVGPSGGVERFLCSMAPATTNVKSLCGGSVGSGAVEGGVRQRVIRGLVKTLVPWEHSRRSQRAALLVLGNVLGNVVDGVENKVGQDSQLLVRRCAIELDQGLSGGGDLSEGVQEEEEDEQEEQRSKSGRGDRLAHKRIEFLDSIAGLVREGGQPDEDDLAEELREAVTVVRKVLK